METLYTRGFKLLTNLMRGFPSPPTIIEATPTGEVDGTLLGTGGAGRVNSVILRCKGRSRTGDAVVPALCRIQQACEN